MRKWTIIFILPYLGIYLGVCGGGLVCPRVTKEGQQQPSTHKNFHQCLCMRLLNNKSVSLCFASAGPCSLQCYPTRPVIGNSLRLHLRSLMTRRNDRKINLGKISSVCMGCRLTNDLKCMEEILKMFNALSCTFRFWLVSFSYTHAAVKAKDRLCLSGLPAQNPCESKYVSR